MDSNQKNDATTDAADGNNQGSAATAGGGVSVAGTSAAATTETTPASQTKRHYSNLGTMGDSMKHTDYKTKATAAATSTSTPAVAVAATTTNLFEVSSNPTPPVYMDNINHNSFSGMNNTNNNDNDTGTGNDGNAFLFSSLRSLSSDPHSSSSMYNSNNNNSTGSSHTGNTITVSGLFGDLNANFWMSGNSLLFESIHSDEDLFNSTSAGVAGTGASFSSSASQLSATATSAAGSPMATATATHPLLESMKKEPQTPQQRQEQGQRQSALAPWDDRNHHEERIPHQHQYQPLPRVGSGGTPVAAGSSSSSSAMPRPKVPVSAHQIQHPHPQPSVVPNTTVQYKLQNMNVSERQRGTHDLHGMSEVVPEDPVVIEALLQQMNKYIVASYCHELLVVNTTTNNDNHSSILGWAFTEHPEYVGNEKLRFLRAQWYDPKQAVAAMAVYYYKKWLYFGRSLDTVCCDLTLQRFSATDLHYFQQGAMQMVEDRDRAGRTVSITFLKAWESVPIESAVRVRTKSQQEIWLPPVYCFYYLYLYQHFWGIPDTFCKNHVCLLYNKFVSILIVVVILSLFLSQK